MIALFDLVIAVTFYKIFPTSKHFKPDLIRFAHFRESLVKKLADPKFYLLLPKVLV
ncbi:hypothetical protein [Acinetobacter sp.]|uniref:hypothetical protein n=1 Tax=Acinetobacter sp. TaxID=472 RepID=UPI003890AC59